MVSRPHLIAGDLFAGRDVSHRGVGPPDIPPAHRRARPPTSGSLAVELHGTVVGQLEGDAATCDFVPSSEGMARFGVSSPALSVAIPLTRSQASRAFANRLRLANPPGPFCRDPPDAFASLPRLRKPSAACEPSGPLRIPRQRNRNGRERRRRSHHSQLADHHMTTPGRLRTRAGFFGASTPLRGDLRPARRARGHASFSRLMIKPSGTDVDQADSPNEHDLWHGARCIRSLPGAAQEDQAKRGPRWRDLVRNNRFRQRRHRGIDAFSCHASCVASGGWHPQGTRTTSACAACGGRHPQRTPPPPARATNSPSRPTMTARCPSITRAASRAAAGPRM